jgi:hypothetical protein
MYKASAGKLRAPVIIITCSGTVNDRYANTSIEASLLLANSLSGQRRVWLKLYSNFSCNYMQNE